MKHTTEVDLADLPDAYIVPLPEGIEARIVFKRDGSIHTVDGVGIEIARRGDGQVAAIYVHSRA